jgi:predicted phage tail protein
MVGVHLYGPLATKYGHRHEFLISSPREAVHALDANFPGFLADFARCERYLIIADDDPREGEFAATAPASHDIHLCPQVEGGAFLGAALVGALFPAIAGTTTATIIGGVLFAGLMLGVSLLFSPKPETKVSDDTAKDENYSFSGPENVTIQGVAVPLVYGRVHCGSVVVSAGLEIGELATASVSAPQPVAPTNPQRGVEAGLPAPQGGWPQIVNLQGYPNQPPVWGPQGWVNSQVTTTTYGNPPVQKLLRIWTPKDNPRLAGDGSGRRFYYAYNEIRGYYHLTSTGTTALLAAGDEEWPVLSEAGYSPEDDEFTDT